MPNDQKEFAHKGQYEKIGRELGRLADSIISEYDYPAWEVEPLFPGCSFRHAEQVQIRKGVIKVPLNAAVGKSDYRIDIIALLDAAQELLEQNDAEIKSLYARLDRPKKKQG